MTHTPKAGDTVYNVNGEMALYVSPAQDGGHIVQPLLQDGDGVTEPESHYVDGVALWPKVYKEPPQPMLDQAIAEQQARLSLLRGEVRDLERQKMEAQRDSAEVRRRLQEHEALRYLDDFLNGTITHYVVQIEGAWKLLDNEGFKAERGLSYYERTLTLWARVGDKGKTLQWQVKPSGDIGSREIWAFPSLEPAQAKAVELVTEAMRHQLQQLRQGYAWSVQQVIDNARALGVPVLPELADAIRAHDLQQRTSALVQARAALAKAEAAMAEVQPAAA